MSVVVNLARAILGSQIVDGLWRASARVKADEFPLGGRPVKGHWRSRKNGKRYFVSEHMREPRLGVEAEQGIVQAYRARDRTVVQIAKAYGVVPRTVYNVLERTGVRKFKRRGR